jgi:hypothetical protein
MSFIELLNLDYPAGHSWLEGEYKKALKAMTRERAPRVVVDRRGRKTKTGQEPTGLDHGDFLTFPGG